MRGLGRSLGILASLVLVVAGSGPARAKPDYKAFGLERLDGYVELGVRGLTEDLDGKDAGTFFSKKEFKVDEILHLGLGGFVYHPNLLRVNAGLDLHVLQELVESDNLILPGGHLNLSFLENKPYGLNLHASVVDTDIDRRFGPTFRMRSQDYGAEFRLSRGPLPFTVSYLHFDRDRSGDPLNEYQSVGDQVEFSGSYDFSEESGGQIRYYFRDMVAGGPLVGLAASRQHDFTANNVTYFGPDHRKRLQTLVRYYGLSGRQDVSTTSLLENYDWRHTETLSTDYRFEYAHQETDPQVRDRINLGAGIAHRLWGSLGSRLAFSGSYEDASFGRTARYGGLISESYNKRLGDWGSLRIGFSPRAEVQMTRPEQETADVVGERVRFPDVVPVQLRQTDIIISSIEVWNTDRSFLFQEGLDYEVLTTGGVTELRRLASPPGRILPGDETLVDYTHRLTEGDLLVYGFRADTEIRYRNWVGLFGDYRRDREKVLDGNLNRTLLNPERWTVGLRTDQRWISAEVAFESYDTSARDSTGMYQMLTLTMPRSRWGNASLSASHRTTDYTNPSEKVAAWRAAARFNLRLGRRGLFDLLADYESERWSSDSPSAQRDRQAIGVSPSLRWGIRRFEVKMGAYLAYVLRPGKRETRSRFFVRLRRYF